MEKSPFYLYMSYKSFSFLLLFSFSAASLSAISDVFDLLIIVRPSGISLWESSETPNVFALADSLL